MRSGNENQDSEMEKGSKRWDRSHQRAEDSKVGEGLALLLFSFSLFLFINARLGTKRVYKTLFKPLTINP